MKKAIVAMCVFYLFGCSAHQVKPEAQAIEIVTALPEKANCQLLGEVVGSQGNWITGDFTSNENLVIGARNELRNKAYDLGGNLVLMQDTKNTNAWGSLGTTNTTVVGTVYKCTK